MEIKSNIVSKQKKMNAIIYTKISTLGNCEGLKIKNGKPVYIRSLGVGI